MCTLTLASSCSKRLRDALARAASTASNMTSRGTPFSLEIASTTVRISLLIPLPRQKLVLGAPSSVRRLSSRSAVLPAPDQYFQWESSIPHHRAATALRPLQYLPAGPETCVALRTGCVASVLRHAPHSGQSDRG